MCVLYKLQSDIKASKLNHRDGRKTPNDTAFVFRVAFEAFVLKNSETSYLWQNLKLSIGKYIDSHRFLNLAGKMELIHPFLLKIVLYWSADLSIDLTTCGNDWWDSIQIISNCTIFFSAFLYFITVVFSAALP